MKEKILICGILPPPFFGHSMIYKTLMGSPFKDAFDITFMDIRFWSYRQHKKVTVLKLLKFIKYYFQYIFLILVGRPRYVLYSISFDKMPFLKDFIFCMTGRLLGRRIILHDMGQYLKVLYDTSGPLYKKFIRMLLNHTAACIVLGEKTREVYQGFIDQERTISVLGSVEDSKDTVVNGPVKKGREIQVLYLSFLSVTKGVWTALEAVPEVLKRKKDVRFVFAGPVESGTLSDEIDRFLTKHALRDKTTLTGYVGDDQDRTRLFRSSDIFIFPTHRDVFGLVLLHALAEGVPVVASVEGAIPEIIEDGRNGFLFPKGDHQQLAQKILSLVDDPKLRENITAENRKRYLENFTIEQYGRRMIRAFEKIKTLS